MAPQKNTPSQPPNDPAPAPQLRLGRLLLVCLLAVIFCGWLVWFAITYLPDCCGP